MQREDGTRSSEQSQDPRSSTSTVSWGIVRPYYASLRRTARLFGPGERFVQTRLATIGRVAMNDPTLGRLVGRGNRRANLIGGALWRGADLFLQFAQVRLNASIV